MNCKPGQMAFVTSHYRDRALVNLPVCVERSPAPLEVVTNRKGESSCPHNPQYPSWVCTGHSESLPMIIGDAYLRPFSDPGIGEVDEVIQRLGKPVTNEPVAA